MTAVAAIEASGLVKSFGRVRAVDGMDLAVPRGGVFGLLGPNGAGKTTTIRIFTTLTRPDAGSARVLGHDVTTDPQAVRRRISLTGQFAALDPGLTGVENLILQARLLGLTRRSARARASGLVEAFGLTGAGRRAVKTYSGGMRRRLDIAASMVATPALLMVFGLGLVMGYRPGGGWSGAVLAVALIMAFAFSMSWVWATLGLILRSPQTVSLLSFAIQFPLTFASNVFVNPATMPGWLRAFVDANPVRHLVTAERGLMDGTVAAGQAGWVLLASAALVAIFGPITMRLYRSRP